MHRALLFSFALSSLALPVKLAQAAEVPVCLKSVIPASDPVLSYQRRTNRCEGLFMQPVAVSANIRIVGYHEHALDFKEGVSAPLRIVVNGAPAGRTVFIRAISTKFRQHYRMDAQVSSATSFLWDRDILNKILTHHEELVMTACYRVTAESGGSESNACSEPNMQLLPISIVADGSVSQPPPEIVLSAGVDLSKLYIRLTRIPDGKVVIDDLEVLRGRPLLALTPYRFPLSRFWQTGSYQIRVTGVPRDEAVAVDASSARLSIP
jgi:hypothetical protein